MYHIPKELNGKFGKFDTRREMTSLISVRRQKIFRQDRGKETDCCFTEHFLVGIFQISNRVNRLYVILNIFFIEVAVCFSKN